MKSRAERFGRTILQIAFLLPILLFAAACAGPVKSLYPPQAGERARTVYVINHGALHTGLAVKRSDISRGAWPANRDYSTVQVPRSRLGRGRWLPEASHNWDRSERARRIEADGPARRWI